MNFDNIPIRTIKDIKKYKKIVIYGAGYLIERVINMFECENIIAIVDKNDKKQGEYVRGYKIEGLEYFESKENIDCNTAVVFAIVSAQLEVAECLINEYNILPEQIFSLTMEFSERNIYQPEKIKDNQSKIESVYDILADEDSKKYYINYIYYILTRMPMYLSSNPCIIGKYIYRSENDITPEGKKSILDCGAYIGDTAEYFLKMAAKKCIVWCFEPFYKNYLKLESWVNENNRINRVKTFHMALGYKNIETYINLDADIERGVNITHEDESKNRIKEGYERINVMTLDSIIKDNFIDFIKMDIEGDEADAILGAKGIILNHKPQMMISAYHKIEHIWELPLLIKEIVPEYKIYFGHQPDAVAEPEFYITI